MPSIRRNVCARRSRPGKTPAGTQKVRGGCRPTAAFPHECPDANRHRVRLDDPLECGSAVRIIGACKGARGPQRWFQAVAHKAKSAIRETNARQGLQATHGRVK